MISTIPIYKRSLTPIRPRWKVITHLRDGDEVIVKKINPLFFFPPESGTKTIENDKVYMVTSLNMNELKMTVHLYFDIAPKKE